MIRVVVSTRVASILQLDEESLWPGLVLEKTLRGARETDRFRYAWPPELLRKAIDEATDRMNTKEWSYDYPSGAARALNIFIRNASAALDREAAER